MGGKHLKRLRADRAKVHFKKKALPKGQNLTNTTFTVKKILTVEQLKKVGENEPVSNWNVPLKDLLVRLNHYNVTSKLNGLHGIKELLTKYPQILKGPSVQSLVSKLLELITDEEPKVRIATVDVLAYLFNLIPSPSILPFHDILNVHLGCAMTHRNVSVQQDSLNLIDLMIKYTPGAVRHKFKKISENFLRIIKNYLYEAHTSTFSVTGSKQNLGKTKIKMLLRFYKFLVVGCPLTKDEEEMSDCRNNNINISAKHRINLRNLSNQYKNIPDLSLLFKCFEDRDKILTAFDTDEFQSLCSHIIPMLFDTWVEFSPNQVASEYVLTEEIGELLSVILKILLFLYSKAEDLKDAKIVTWFISNYGPAFQNSFTLNFPCLPSFTVKESKSSNSSEFSDGPDTFMTQNLVICYLSYLFKIVPKNSSIETKMENFLSDILMMNNTTEVQILSKVVELVINSSYHKNSNDFPIKVVGAYNTTRSFELRQCLSKILMNIVLKENECTKLKDNSAMNWMKSLPHRLCESQIFVQELETILKLISKEAGIEVVKEVECKAEEIIINLPVIKIRGIPQLEGQRMIANILYRCSNEVLERIIEKNLDNMLSPLELRNYVRDIFSQKLKNQSEFY